MHKRNIMVLLWQSLKDINEGSTHHLRYSKSTMTNKNNLVSLDASNLVHQNHVNHGQESYPGSLTKQKNLTKDLLKI